MLREKIEILNQLGLHARASAKLTQLAGQYQSEIWLVILELEVDGPDESDALDAIKHLVSDLFGEGQ